MKNREDFTQPGLVVLRGQISQMQRRRREHDFILDESQHRAMEATAVIAALSGMTAQATALTGASSSTAERADWLEFDLDGKRMMDWVWRLPFGNRTEVEVVAKPVEDGYMVYAIRRIDDGLMAIYPHATRGRKAHARMAIKLWFWISLVVDAIASAMSFSGVDSRADIYITLAVGGLMFMLFSAILFWRVSRRYKGFVRLAEKIFAAFEWPDVKNIDLKKRSKHLKLSTDEVEYGIYTFRY